MEFTWLDSIKNVLPCQIEQSVFLEILLILLLIFTLFRLVFFIIKNIYLSVYSESLRQHMSVAATDFCIRSKVGEISNADLMNVAIIESSNVAKLARDVLNLLTQILIVGAVFIVLVFANILIIAGIFILLSLGVFLYRFFLNSYSHRLGTERLRIATMITSRIKQVIDGAVDIYSLKINHFSQKYIADSFWGYGITIGQITNLREAPAKVVEVILVGLFVTAVLFADINSQDSGAALATLGVFFVGLMRIGSASAQIYGIFLSISNKMPSLKAVEEAGLFDFKKSFPAKSSSGVREITFNTCVGGRNDQFKVGLINITFDKGRVHAIAGQSGVGKTTLAYILADLMPVDEFSSIVDDKEINDAHRFFNEVNVVYVPQSPVFFDLSVYENLTIASTGISRCYLCDLMKDVGLESYCDILDKKISNVAIQPSGGQLKRLAMLRGILAKPDFLIIDEPTSGLDEDTERKVLNLILSISDNMIVVVITHSESVLGIASQVLNMKTGIISGKDIS